MIDDLTPARTKSIMERSMEDISSVFEETRLIVNDVKAHGNAVALKHYKKHKEDITAADLEVTREEIEEAYTQIDKKVVDALKFAAENIVKFHRAQLEREMWSIEVRKGILAGRITRAMDIVGCYIPGGTAAYPSSILMTVLPAKVAGVENIIAITPPSKGMKVRGRASPDHDQRSLYNAYQDQACGLHLHGTLCACPGRRLRLGHKPRPAHRPVRPYVLRTFG